MKFKDYNGPYRLLLGRPAFRLAATPPCRFIPCLAGRGTMPFDFLHSSLLELRGPCDDMCSNRGSESTCIESDARVNNCKKGSDRIEPASGVGSLDAEATCASDSESCQRLESI